ncbi:MAG: hypothetical protein JW726_03180 [Anaerolineales bacterium]|nr:hypothetical protein [Anaerolineales bacterium]
MDMNESQPQPAPPNVLSALRGGFDAAANHASLLLIPMAIDLLIWLGPHLRLQELMMEMLDGLASTAGMSTTEVLGLPAESTQVISDVLGRLNLMMTLRSYPIGIPSLMAGRLPLEIPGGEPLVWAVPSLSVVMGIWGLLTVIGLAVGILYYQLVAQAALAGKVQFREAFAQWPRSALQIFLLTILLGLVLFMMGVPFSCAFSLLPLGGAQLGLMLYAGLAVWILFPLVFTPHGVFAMHYNLLMAFRKSERLVRLTFPATVMMLVVILVTSQVLDLLWRVPAENSWLNLVSVAGHAFVATGLLAATFIYYRDADRWVEDVIRKMKVKALA